MQDRFGLLDGDTAVGAAIVWTAADGYAFAICL